MIVELIPKQIKKPVFGQVFFLIVSIAVLAGTAVSLFIFQQLIGTARANLAILEKQFSQDTQPQEQELAEKLVEYKQIVEDFKFVAGERKSFLPFFKVLEKTTHPDVFFLALDETDNANVLALDGATRNFFALEQQRLVWKELNEFQNVQLKGIKLTGTGSGSFKVEFTLTPELLTTQP